MKRLVPALILAMILQTALPARVARASDPASILAVCTELHDTRAELRLASPLRILWDVLKMTYFPGSLVHVRETSFPVAPALRVQPANGANDSTPGVDVIFSIDPPSDLTNSEEVARMRLRYDELTRTLTREVPRLRQIASAATVEQCVARAVQTSFDFDAFIKLATERNSLQLVGQLKEAATADSVLARVVGGLRLQWQVVHSTEIMAVHEALSNPRLRNIVILSHGLSDGGLVDSRLSEYPLGFFSEISPSIRSITIFACHAEEIAKAYRLAEILETRPSEHGTRLLFVSGGTELPVLGELVPIKAFPSFMRKVDRALAWVAQDPPSGPPEAAVAVCVTRFPSFSVTRGTFGFALNGHFIGSSHAGEHDPEFSYPCEWADRKRNILVIHGLSLLSPALIQSSDFLAVPEHPGMTVENPLLTQYQRDDGTYQGSKFEFELVSQPGEEGTKNVSIGL